MPLLSEFGPVCPLCGGDLELRRDVMVRETYLVSEIEMKDGKVLVTALLDERDEDDLLEMFAPVLGCRSFGCSYAVSGDLLGEPELI